MEIDLDADPLYCTLNPCGFHVQHIVPCSCHQFKDINWPTDVVVHNCGGTVQGEMTIRTLENETKTLHLQRTSPCDANEFRKQVSLLKEALMKSRGVAVSKTGKAVANLRTLAVDNIVSYYEHRCFCPEYPPTTVELEELVAKELPKIKDASPLADLFYANWKETKSYIVDLKSLQKYIDTTSPVGAKCGKLFKC